MIKITILSRLFIKASIFVLLSSCQNNEQGNLKSTPFYNKFLMFEDNLENLETVTYMAVLSPMNVHVVGEVTGSFTFHKDLNSIVADVRVTGSAPNTIHPQNVHLGGSCPTETSDMNLDGIIDGFEAQQVIGNVIIPLDGDINYQYSPLGIFPIADAWGSYVYSQTGSFETFIKDLLEKDEITDDEVTKLVPPIGLIGKVVMIYAIANDIILPETVASPYGLPANQTLPIACGVIHEVTSIPGRFEPDDITIGTIRVGRSTPRTGPPIGSANPNPSETEDATPSEIENPIRTDQPGPRSGPVTNQIQCSENETNGCEGRLD